MQTSSYPLLLRPAGFLLNIALLLGWEYEQPAGTTPSAPSSTTLIPRTCSSCAASCTAVKHSLSAALRWPSGQPLNWPGVSARRGSRAQPEPEACEANTAGETVTGPPAATAAGACGAATASEMACVNGASM